MEEDEVEPNVWVESWARLVQYERRPFIGSFFWLGDICFRLLRSKTGIWMHLYGPPLMGCYATRHMGGPDWAAGSFDWQAEQVVMAIEERSKKRPGDAPTAWTGDHESAAAYPILVERLTALKFASGKPRKPDTLTVMSVDRSWRAVLNDKETGESLWVTAESLVELYEAFEIELRSDTPNWRDTRANLRPGQKKT